MAYDDFAWGPSSAPIYTSRDAWASKGNTIDQRRIVGRRLRAVDALRHWPTLQHVFSSRFQQSDTGGAAQPRLELLLRQQHGHSIVDAADHGVRLGDDH